ncbi:MAG: hypothetical protein ACRCUJ_01585 [Phocaeicola sp.]
MTCTTFPSTGLVPNVTTHVVGNVTYLYKGGAPNAPLWEAITPPINLDQVHTRTFANVDAMLAFSGLVVGQSAKTLGYYEAGDGGGAEYIIVSGNSGDGYGSHSVGTNTAKLNESAIFIEYYGVSVSASDNAKRIQACWDDNLVSHSRDGVYDFNERLVLPSGYGWTFRGSGAGTVLNWTGNPDDWAISGLDKDGVTYRNLYRHVLEDFAVTGTATVSKLLDLTKFKYSALRNVGLYGAAVCLQVRSAWSSTVEDCRFYPYEGHPSGNSYGVGIVLGSYNEDLSLIQTEPNEVNAFNFSSCVIEGAASAILTNSYINNCTFNNGCNIDGCGAVVRAKSSSINYAIRSLVIRDSYLEWCLDSPLIIDIANGQNCGVSVAFVDNYVQPTTTGVATLLNIISTGSSTFGDVAFIRNKEIHRVNNQPSSGYVLHTPVGISELYIKYINEHDSSIIGVFPPVAYNASTIDMRRLSTNVPVKLLGKTYGDGSYAPISNSDPLTITPYMGTMRIRGTAKHTGTNTTPNRPIASIPQTAKQTSYEVFTLCPLRASSGVITQGYAKLVNTELWVYGIADNGVSLDFSYRTNTPQDYDGWQYWA